MGTYDVSTKNGRTVIKKRHPIVSAFWIVFAVALLIGSIAQAPWLIVPAVGIVAWAVHLQRRKGSTSA